MWCPAEKLYKATPVNSKISTTYFVDCFIVHHKWAVRMFECGVRCENRIIGLNNGCTDTRRWNLDGSGEAYSSMDRKAGRWTRLVGFYSISFITFFFSNPTIDYANSSYILRKWSVMMIVKQWNRIWTMRSDLLSLSHHRITMLFYCTRAHIKTDSVNTFYRRNSCRWLNSYVIFATQLNHSWPLAWFNRTWIYAELKLWFLSIVDR